MRNGFSRVSSGSVPRPRAPRVRDGRARPPLALLGLVAPLLAAALLAACGGADEPDAYGNFETTEVTVSAEASGRLLRFEPAEGRELEAGEIVGLVDTTTVVLERRELRSRQRAARARLREAARQIEVLRVQFETAREEYARDLRLFEDSAATARQVNQRKGDIRMLEERIESAGARSESLEEEIAAIDARLEQVRERLADSRIENPRDGMVLTVYADRGEYVGVGQPLYEIAELDTLKLRVYVSGARLAHVGLGSSVTVHYDIGEDERVSVPGVVTKVASEAEFTPTPIQTREERVSFVYAVEIAVPNPEGAIKVGMPGDVEFLAGDGGRR